MPIYDDDPRLAVQVKAANNAEKVLQEFLPGNPEAWLPTLWSLAFTVPQPVTVPLVWFTAAWGEEWRQMLGRCLYHFQDELGPIAFKVEQRETRATVTFTHSRFFKPQRVYGSAASVVKAMLEEYRRKDGPLLVDLKELRVTRDSMKQIVTAFNVARMRRISMTALDTEGRYYEITEREENQYNTRGYRTEAERFNRLHELLGHKAIDNSDTVEDCFK